MTTPPIPPDAHLLAFRRILLTVHVGRPLSINTIRDLVSAAGLDGPSLGGLFRAAVSRGWLAPTGRVEASTDPAARGRMVQVYRRRPIAQRRAAA